MRKIAIFWEARLNENSTAYHIHIILGSNAYIRAASSSIPKTKELFLIYGSYNYECLKKLLFIENLHRAAR